MLALWSILRHVSRSVFSQNEKVYMDWRWTVSPGPLWPMGPFLWVRKDELEMQAAVLAWWTDRASVQSKRHHPLGTHWEGETQTDSASLTISARRCWTVIKLNSPGPALTWLHPYHEGHLWGQMKFFWACFANSERSYMFWGLLPQLYFSSECSNYRSLKLIFAQIKNINIFWNQC